MNGSEENKDLRESILKFNRELRRDMSTLQGYLETLEDKVRSAELLRHVQSVQTESDRIIRKLSAMSNVIGLEEGEVHFNPQAFSPRQLVEQAHAFFKHEYPAVDLSIDLDPKIAPTVIGDRDVLFDVVHGIYNLFADHGAARIRILVALSQEVDNEQFVTISVDADQSRLSVEKLQPLVVPDSASKSDEITGTPLVFDWAIHLLRSRGVEPEVSSPGRDKVAVTFYDQWEAVNESQKAHSGSMQVIDHLRILVAEDNPLNQLVTRMMIENLDWECDVVGDGQEALETFDPSVHHCIIMDLEMPVMNGIESTRKIRAAHGMDTPIIALTADAMHEIRNDLDGAGLDDFLVKPVKRDVLEEKIRFALRKKLKKTG